jgi:hypothetical protein
MPPRKHRSTAKSPVKTQINNRPTVPLRTIQSSSVARYNGPITRSRTARSLASIDSLPFEVLSTIFILTLASNEEIVKRSSAGWTNPLPLCAVSSLWRTLALATPKLWSRVFVYVPDDKSKGMATRLVPWIKRSGSLPLTLFIRYCRPYRSGSKIGNSVVKILNRYASRWEALYVQLPQYVFVGNSLELIRLHEWSSLQRMYGVKPYVTVTCAQLTHLHFSRHSSVSYAQVVHIFKGCPRLVWLSLFHVAPHFITNVPASPIILHDLSFVSFSANNLSAIFQLVSLPSLRELFCRQRQSFTERRSLRSLLSLLTRSACTLDKLEIRGMNYLPADLVQCLTHRSCHFLTSLGIYNYVPYDNVPVNDEVLRTLTLRHDNSACTHLKFLSLNCPAQCSQSAFLRMVESRISSCTTSQLQDGLLHLQIENYREPLNSQQRLDEVIKRSEMEYESRETVRLWRRGFRGDVPTLHDFF